MRLVIISLCAIFQVLKWEFKVHMMVVFSPLLPSILSLKHQTPHFKVPHLWLPLSQVPILTLIHLLQSTFSIKFDATRGDWREILEWPDHRAMWSIDSWTSFFSTWGYLRGMLRNLNERKLYILKSSSKATLIESLPNTYSICLFTWRVQIQNTLKYQQHRICQTGQSMVFSKFLRKNYLSNVLYTRCGEHSLNIVI